MRMLSAALFAGATLLAACGGESRNAAPEATPSGTPTTNTAVTLAPITGTVHVVNMVGDANGYRYEPATINAKAGDAVKFVMQSLGPHNVAFDPAGIPAGQKEQLWANMGENSMDGLSPMMITDNEEWTLSLGNLAPGTYPYFCTPHIAMSMKGEIIIQ